MKDLCLRFTDEAAMLSALRSVCEAHTIDGVEQIADSEKYALDIVGEIPGRSGFHANLRVMDDDMDVSSLDPYVVFPANPVRVWA